MLYNTTLLHGIVGVLVIIVRPRQDIGFRGVPILYEMYIVIPTIMLDMWYLNVPDKKAGEITFTIEMTVYR